MRACLGEQSEQPRQGLGKLGCGGGVDAENPTVAARMIEGCEPLGDRECFMQGAGRSHSRFVPFGQVSVYQRFTLCRNALGGAPPQEDQKIKKRDAIASRRSNR